MSFDVAGTCCRTSTAGTLRIVESVTDLWQSLLAVMAQSWAADTSEKNPATVIETPEPRQQAARNSLLADLKIPVAGGT